MGGRQIRPARVYQTVTQELNHRALAGSSSNPPPWYKVMTTVPPAETLVRTIAPRHSKHDIRTKKPKNIFRPKQIVYLEDQLRQVFYKDHPWELARPRIILELDGKDYQRCDWSKGVQQSGIPLTGECVVQRQMWLIENQQMDEKKAYDVTRHEFYRHRQAEEIEKRVAVEEARHVGAYFGNTRTEVSHYLEDREFENWKIWAGKQTEQDQARRNSEIESFGVEEEDPEVENEADPSATAEDEAVAKAPGKL
ncbi:mitochondrial ribosomal protein S25 [Thelonectria olida]|uniref:37S ribosomal protein S25, mitochondrial n=1 Tax=Thelonectria olida TaxID=1576542 RepID=A0A9P8WCN5_9HYPO|nr:mitochondrial ribosomal protein S25 [Thelonectria olida]